MEHYAHGVVAQDLRVKVKVTRLSKVMLFECALRKQYAYNIWPLYPVNSDRQGGSLRTDLHSDGHKYGRTSIQSQVLNT